MTIKRTFVYLAGTALFALQGGLLSSAAQADQVFLDDVIVEGSLCAGLDCANGESFGFDTLRLKENNLRIHFDDTSSTASFPQNDWRIVANDSGNGGLNRFSIEDSTGGRLVTTIEAGAPANSHYIDSGGRLGLGTNQPVVELHVVNGDSPTLRLEQDGSSGFTPQTWDVAGNEAGFFIRDATNGSQLAFRIRSGADASAIDIAADNDIGMGTASPQSKLHVVGGDGTLRLSNTEANSTIKEAVFAGTHFTTGEEPVLGMRMSNQSGENFLLFGGGSTSYNSSTQLLFITASNTTSTSGTERMRVDAAGNLLVARTTEVAGTVIAVGTDTTNGNGATLTDGGAWTDGSSRAHKINIKDLDAARAVAVVKSLEPVTYNGKGSSDETYVGFIAEDVPDLVAMNHRKGIAAMEISAVVTKVVQEHQKTIEAQEKTIEAQDRSIADLTARIDQLEKLLLDN